MIRIEKYGPTVGGYGYSISGNKFEEEFFVIVSFRQDATCDYTILKSSVDHHVAIITRDSCEFDKLVEAVRPELIKWCYGGLEGTKEEVEINDKMIQEVLNRMYTNFYE